MHTFFRVLIILFTTTLCAQNTLSFCEKSSAILTLLEKNHYQPKPIDDNFSEYVYTKLFERLDTRRLLYSETDIETFETFKTQFDDFLINQQCDFISAITKSYKQQLELALKTIEKIEKSRLDFSGKDTATYGSFREKATYSITPKALEDRWLKKIRIDIITDYLSLSNPLKFRKVKAELKAKVIAENKCFIVDKLQAVNGLESYVETTFLDVVCSYFDPHTNFMDPTDNTAFMNSIGTETNSIGVWFSKNGDGKIIVSGLQTGSKAWKEKKISAGDLVLSLEANDEKISTTCLSLQSLYEFISDEKFQQITIHVLTEKNNQESITLAKENLKIEANAVNSFILKGKKNIGYISLPSFYTNVDYGFGSANDIAKELFKLNAVNIDGLILDLRGNGGGSMKQAIDLAGMFIDKGPLGIYRDHNDKKTIVKDINRGTLFTKPLLILLNNESASASEFLAAALRDHNRAIIVGSKTYGKGTVQQVVPLPNNAGYVKLTIEKMYGFKGNSHQAVGIIPDIEFPSFYTNIENGEADNSTHIINDTINKNVYFDIAELSDYSKIRAQSNSRMKQNQAATTIRKINTDLLSYLESVRKIPISVEGMKKDRDAFDAIFSNSDTIEIAHKSFEVVNLEDYQEILAYRKDKAKQNSYALESTQKDHEIEEAYHILIDYINQLAQ